MTHQKLSNNYGMEFRVRLMVFIQFRVIGLGFTVRVRIRVRVSYRFITSLGLPRVQAQPKESCRLSQSWK